MPEPAERGSALGHLMTAVPGGRGRSGTMPAMPTDATTPPDRTDPNGGPPSLGVDLDHLAVAVERHADAWPRYLGDLAATWEGGGDGIGFAPAQVRFAGGMKIEVLEPHRVDEDDFLRRFLDRSGPGPHHLTFKVDDLTAAIDGARALGIEPVGINRSDPQWMEAFLHPRTAWGIVVQLAESHGDWEPDTRPAAPPPRVDAPARLVRVVHLVADLDRALTLFEGLLGGCSESGGGDLTWPGGGRIRLVQPADGSTEAAWLGARPGRLHHVEVEVAEPDAVAGAVARPDGRFEVAPDDNLGLRLVLWAPGEAEGEPLAMI